MAPRFAGRAQRDHRMQRLARVGERAARPGKQRDRGSSRTAPRSSMTWPMFIEADDEFGHSVVER